LLVGRRRAKRFGDGGRRIQASRACRQRVEGVVLQELCQDPTPQLGVDQDEFGTDRLEASRFGVVGDGC
jgi:hypothetical protein